MLFLKKAATCVLALLAVPSIAALTPTQMIDNINVLIAKSQALQEPAQSITILNGPLIVIGQGPFPQIISGFTDIIQTTTTAIAQMQGTEKVTVEDDRQAIAKAFREFVRVHQVLLNTLIGKAGLFNTVPVVGQPVASVLRQLEAVVDTIAFGLIDIVESDDMKAQADSLSGTITIAIDSYDGLGLELTKRHVRDFST
ncbi:hypothetical protein TWF730_010302 [Orbilia blumenaviensis]|uniref:Uncharacterized protein n=1 Tax=Orbilia blumenaviensis TaxID=1796055 RepID=A0AAV9UNN4_9PEZI